jgi:hypothetical protein
LVRTVSFDLCFWESGTGAPEEIYNDACDGDDHRLVASEKVLRFRSELLDRWVSFSDLVEPLEYDPDADEQPNLDRYVLVTVPHSLIGELSELVKLARSYGLTVYDPQAEQVLPE